jgi:carbon monoxide dehydrogenase subunit G
VPSVERTFEVVAASDVVLEYLKDFAHTEAWDPGTLSCTRNDSGPVIVGSSWHNVSKVAGVETELTYTLNKMADNQLIFVGVNDSATSTDSITVRPTETGSRLTYRADIEMHGLSKFLAPAIKLVFEKVANDTEKQLTAVLNAL